MCRSGDAQTGQLHLLALRIPIAVLVKKSKHRIRVFFRWEKPRDVLHKEVLRPVLGERVEEPARELSDSANHNVSKKCDKCSARGARGGAGGHHAPIATYSPIRVTS